jgi:Ca2+/Na+ antiporter
MKKEVLYPIYVLIALLLVVAGIVFFVYKYGQEDMTPENTSQPALTTATSTYTLTPAQAAEKQSLIQESLSTDKVTLTKAQADAKLKLLKQLQAGK